MRRRSTTIMAAVIALLLTVFGPGLVRGDIPPRPPKPPPAPTLAGGDVPRPLHVIVAGVALAAAIASTGVWLARGGGKARHVSGLGVIIAAAAIASGAGLLAYWSHSALKNYDAEKARIDAEYQAQRRNWRPIGPVRSRTPAAAPESSKAPPAPSPS